MSQTPPPPPPTGGYGAPQPGFPPPPAGLPRPAELLDRFLARLIDGVLLGVVGGILDAIFVSILVSDRTLDVQTGDYHGGSRILFDIVFGIVLTIVYVGYPALMESATGQTVGKMVMKLKTVGSDGTSNPTLEQAVKRNIWLATPLGFIIPVIGPLLTGLAALVGVILIAVGINNDTVRRQGWHDKFATTTTVLKIG